MKITFNTPGPRETDKQYVEKQRMTKSEKSYNAYQTKLYQENAWMQNFGNPKEKGKSLIELQQEAGFVDVSVKQDYMTIMSNTMSEEDYAKLQEEGFDFSGMDPEEAVTIVDKIKAELVRSGQHIAGYTDDLDVETLAAALGSDALARSVSESFRQADIPMTPENIENVGKAWEMASQLKTPQEGSNYYMMDNALEPEIWNLYLAQSSGAGNGTGGAPRYYAEDIQGYFTQSAVAGAGEELRAQMDKVIIDAGMEVNADNRQAAEWLLEKNLPLTPDNLVRLQELEGIVFPVEEDAFAHAAAIAIAEGKLPIHGNLAQAESIYDRAATLTENVLANMEALLDGGDITARRQLEEIRLRMTAEVNVKLLKSGFSIDTASMEQLVATLKQAEAELANSYFPDDAQAVGKYEIYRQATQIMAELPHMPAQTLGGWSVRSVEGTILEFHGEAKLSQQAYQKAQESYETLMTAPRGDMGDSIKKAFANVDDILADMDMELSWENQRAVRILGYNRMSITVENMERVKQVDEQVRSVLNQMTPAATLKMIRDGVNPLEKSFEELENYFGQLPEEYESSAESYSRFLYQLEQHKEITPEEREAYIGIYRLVHQIEKSDGAVVGALVNNQMKLQFDSLLSAVRSSRFKHMDVKATDETGLLSELTGVGNSISDQIANGIAAAKELLADVASDESLSEEYNRKELEQIRQAALVEQEAITLLQRGELPANADNLLAAQALVHDGAAPFRNLKNKMSQFSEKGMSEAEVESDGQTSAADVLSETDVDELFTNTLNKLENKEGFQEAYGEMIEEITHQVEVLSLNCADSSMDVRELQLIHKQLTVAGKMAASEEYVLPMYIGDELVKVHLTLEKGAANKSSVSIGVDFGTDGSELHRVEAHLQLWEGKISGFLVGNTREEVTKLQQASDIFHKLVMNQSSVEWQVDELSIVSVTNEVTTVKGMSTAAVPVGVTEADHAGRAANVELYHVAKLFLQAMKE